MEGRLKKLFHRKKTPERYEAVDHRSDLLVSNPDLRTSAYESTAAAGGPETGEFPLHGNGKIPTVDRRRSWHQLGSPSKGHHASNSEVTPAARAAAAAAAAAGRPTSHPWHDPSPIPTNGQGSRSNGPIPGVSLLPGEDRGKEYIRLSTELSNLRLNDTKASGPQYPQARSAVIGPNLDDSDQNSSRIRKAEAGKRRSPHKNYSLPQPNEDAGLQNLAKEDIRPSLRVVEPSADRLDPSSLLPPSTSKAHQTDQDVGSRRSVPRKSVGNKIPDQAPLATSASPEHNRRRAKISNKPLPPAPGVGQVAEDNELFQPKVDTAVNNKLPRPNAEAHDGKVRRYGAEKPSLAGIVDLKNSVDTEIIERFAPAVTHETITKEVHNIREEVVTREVHNHDVFHRILPIIDVEVLPTRHYVLNNDGGLVEVFGEEVPGRHGNWVIAETVSTTASNEPIRNGPPKFSARQFPGNEGDTKQYTRPDGVKVTEETWVHPPTLETGAKETGQSVPMVFDSPRKSSPDQKGYRPVVQQESAIQGG